MGSIYKRGDVFSIKYYRHGKPYRESSKGEKITQAERLLNRHNLGTIEQNVKRISRAQNTELIERIGAPGVTRTRGTRIRNPLLYPPELQGQYL